MSSILPPGVKRIKPIKLPEGALVPIAYASKISTIVGEVISAGVAVGIPKDSKKPGLIMEYSASGYRKEVEEIVRHMVFEGFKYRGYEVKRILSKTTQHKVKKIGAAFAGVVLWW